MDKMKSYSNQVPKKPYSKPVLKKLEGDERELAAQFIGKDQSFLTSVRVDGALYLHAARMAFTSARPISEVLACWCALGREVDFQQRLEQAR